VSGIVLFLIITTANANVVLTVNEQSPTELIELDKSEEITIGISDRESSIEAEYDFTLSAFGGILSSCDANDIAASNIPISDLSSEYLFEFTEEFDGLALISLITNKPMIIDDYEVDSGASIYQIVIFELPGIEYYIVFGGGFVATVEAEPVISQATGTSEMTLAESGFGGGAMAMSSWTPPYHYFENPWECPDLSNNNKVDLADFALFAENWLETAAGLKGDFNRDNEVDIIDLNHFALYWLYDVDCPDIIYVKKNTASGDDGESWDTAYDQLYTALSNADSNSQIWVAAGTYYPDPTGLGDSRDAIFTLVAGAEVYGGFTGIEDYLDECDPFVNETILSGDLLGNDDLGYFSDNSYNVVVSGIDAVLDGFTVQGGYNADIGDGAGAGIYIYTDMEVKNCVVRGNWSNQYGGGIYVEDAAVVIHNSLIVENMAYSAIDSRDTYGGGVFGYFSTGNEQIDIINCTISDNLSFNDDLVYNGSGVYIYNNNNTNLENSIVWNNLLYYGGYYYLDNIVANFATVTASFCDYDYSFNVEDGGNNIAVDPYFVDAANGDYHLESVIGRWDNATSSWVTDNYQSFCIDAGDPCDDIGFEPMPNGGIINMGCYGGTKYASKNEALGSFQVTITPPEAIIEGAIWRLYRKIGTTYYACDGSWHNSGETIEHLPTGNNYYIAVKDIEGYVPEPDGTYQSIIEAYILDASYAISAGSNPETVNYVGATWIYVSISGSDATGTGNSGDPYRTIQHAIDSDLGNRIAVGNGTFVENINIDRSVRVFSTNGRNYTTIQGTGSGSVVTMSNNAILDNLTIRGGFSTNGGGVYANSGSIRDCIIRNNYATFNGGGVYACCGADIDIYKCIIYGNNTGLYGDGDQIFAEGCYLTVSYSEVEGIYQTAPPVKLGFFETSDCAYNNIPPTDGGNNENY